MYNHNKAQQSKTRVHISWDIVYPAHQLVAYDLIFIYIPWDKAHNPLAFSYSSPKCYTLHPVKVVTYPGGWVAKRQWTYHRQSLLGVNLPLTKWNNLQIKICYMPLKSVEMPCTVNLKFVVHALLCFVVFGIDQFTHIHVYFTSAGVDGWEVTRPSGSLHHWAWVPLTRLPVSGGVVT